MFNSGIPDLAMFELIHPCIIPDTHFVDWSSLPDSVVSAESVSCFKSRLGKFCYS